jgi:hypothetical protein
MTCPSVEADPIVTESAPYRASNLRCHAVAGAAARAATEHRRRKTGSV